jgi:protein involved in polysaccharide export with SLBB domain
MTRPLLLGLILGLLAGRVTGQNATDPVPTSPATASSATTNAPAGQLEKLDAEARDLKPGDVLRFGIEQDPSKAKLMQLVDITEAGEALFPVTKESDSYVKLNARGKKLADLRKEVKTLLDAEFYHDCTVKIDLDRIRRDALLAGPENSSKVTVFGVTTGSVIIREGETKTLTDLVLQMGQLPRADLSNVKIRRLDPTTQRETISVHNVRDLLKRGDRSKDPLLQDGDRVEIPEKTFNF